MARKAAVFAAALGFALLSSGASAGPIILDTWVTFTFSGVIGDPLAGGPWTFNCPADHCTVTVTDGFLPIDQFQFFDFGTSIGTTSVPSGDATHTCGADPVACLADPQMSHGVFVVLGSGAHSLTGILTMGDRTLPGAAFFSVVPEPASLLLIGSGLLMLFGIRRRA